MLVFASILPGPKLDIETTIHRRVLHCLAAPVPVAIASDDGWVAVKCQASSELLGLRDSYLRSELFPLLALANRHQRQTRLRWHQHSKQTGESCVTKLSPGKAR